MKAPAGRLGFIVATFAALAACDLQSVKDTEVRDAELRPAQATSMELSVVEEEAQEVLLSDQVSAPKPSSATLGKAKGQAPSLGRVDSVGGTLGATGLGIGGGGIGTAGVKKRAFKARSRAMNSRGPQATRPTATSARPDQRPLQHRGLRSRQ